MITKYGNTTKSWGDQYSIQRQEGKVVVASGKSKLRIQTGDKVNQVYDALVKAALSQDKFVDIDAILNADAPEDVVEESGDDTPEE